MAFTNGRPVDSAGEILCVFVPSIPNPLTGQLRFVRRASCKMVDISAEEAFKVILSTGNYVPPYLGTAAGGSMTFAIASA